MYTCVVLCKYSYVHMCNKAQIFLSLSEFYPTVIIRNSSPIFPSGPCTFSIFYSKIMMALGIYLNMSSEKRHSFLTYCLSSRNNTHKECIFLPAGLKYLFYHVLISYGFFFSLLNFSYAPVISLFLPPNMLF